MLVRGGGLRARTRRTRVASARPTATSQPVDARGHHTQAPDAERPFAVGSESVRFFGITMGRKTLRPDA